MDLGELGHADTAVGAVPFALPDGTATGIGKVSEQSDQHRIARYLSNGLVKGIVGAFAGGAIPGFLALCNTLIE